MSTFDNYRIVQKSFVADRLLMPGEVVDVSNWRNAKGLEDGNKIRKPQTEEDYNLIQEAIKKVEAEQKAASKRNKTA